MNWDSFKVFLAIAETGTLAAASKALGINHSTVFRRIQALESDIGVRLIEKIENKYVLTPMGEQVLDEGKKIAEAFDAIDRRIMGADFQPKGTVKITAPYNIVNRYLSMHLADFCLQYPEIKIDLLSSNLSFNLNNRQADIAIRATSNPPEHLVGRKLSAIPWGVYAGRDYIESHGRLSSLSELSQHRLIGASSTMLKLPGFTWLEENYANSIVVRCDELTAMSYFAEYSHGLAMLPDDQSRAGIVRLMDYMPGKSSDLWLLTHPDLQKVERIRLVMAHLTKVFTQLF